MFPTEKKERKDPFRFSSDKKMRKDEDEATLRMKRTKLAKEGEGGTS